MIKFILAICLLTATLSLPIQNAQASGGLIVFLQAGTSEYKFTLAVRDKWFHKSPLFNYFDSSHDELLVARVNPEIYRMATYYSTHDYDVSLDFDSYQKITFHYYESVNAFIGHTATQETVVLLPESTGEVLPCDTDRPALEQNADDDASESF